MPAHQPPVVANSVPWSDANLLLGTDFLVNDKRQAFVSHAAPQLTSILSQTCQFNVFAVLSHQTLDQLPDRVRSDPPNIDVEICFCTGRVGLEQRAKVIAS